jgi:FixJ family two-component response regulator
MKNGAVAFLSKLINDVALIAGVERALDPNRTYRKEAFEPSPPRRQQVLPLLAERSAEQRGCSRIGNDRKRCTNARWNIMRTMEADSFAALVKIVGKPNVSSSRAS